MKVVRIIGIAIAMLLLVVATMWPQRRILALRLVGLLQPPQPLSEPAPEPDSVAWFDDYFTIERIDADTIAIGEPRYWQQNYSYLIVGSERAILFDSGPGLRDIEAVVASLTTKPVTVAASHLHFDHVGGHPQFDRWALVDLPHLRERAKSNVFQPDAGEHLGFTEGLEPPSFVVDEWWAPGARIELGDRTLEVIHTPGHTPESIVLVDRARGYAFTGDTIYEGPLLAFLPGSDLNDYWTSTKRLLKAVPPNALLLTAHRETPPSAPTLGYRDLIDLERVLAQIQSGELEGEGFYLQSYGISERIRLLAD